jgi:hypothetical protein
MIWVILRVPCTGTRTAYMLASLDLNMQIFAGDSRLRSQLPRATEALLMTTKHLTCIYDLCQSAQGAYQTRSQSVLAQYVTCLLKHRMQH